MKAIVVALVLMVGVIVVLWFGDTLNALGLVSWSGSQVALLYPTFQHPNLPGAIRLSLASPE
jgi:hypothetical protein